MSKGSIKQRPSWKKSPRASQTPNAGPNEYVDGAFGQRGRERRRLLFRVSSLLTLAIGLIVIFWFSFPVANRDVPVMFAGVSESAARISSDPLYAPPNPFAKEDAQLLSEWFRNGADQNLVFINRVEDQTGPMSGKLDQVPTLIRTLTQQLSSIKPGGPDVNTIVMFVTAHGILDADKPYLIVGDSKPDDVSTWVSLESLLVGIKTGLQAIDSKHPGARVVLFLDAMRGGPIWDWGKFDQSFTKRCGEVANQVASDRIAVIVACSDGQRSWWDPRRGESLFARAIVQSLTGQVEDDGDRVVRVNEVVTVGEIEKYVIKQVSNDARAIWAANQVPALLTKSAKAWRVIKQPKRVVDPDPLDVNVDALKERFAELDQLWQKHNAVAKQRHPPIVTQPVAWAVLEKHLARLDQLALAGVGYEAEWTALKNDCNVMIMKLEAGSPVIPKRRLLSELRLDEYFYGLRPRTATEREIDVAWRKEPLPEKIALPPGFVEADTMRLLWPWLMEKSFSTESLNAASGLLDRLFKNQTMSVQYLETHLVRLLSAPDLTSKHNRSADVIVQTHLASRNALFTPDLRASFWIRDRLTKLDAQRLTWSDEALAHGASGDATDRLLRMPDNDYVGLQREGKNVSAAYQLRDQMLHDVPRFAETLLIDVEAFVDDEQGERSNEMVRKATDAVRCLSANLRLEEAGEPINESESLRNAAQAAKVRMDQLQKRLDERVDAVGRLAAGDESGLRKSLALLSGSGVAKAEGRKQIHNRLLQLLREKPVDSQAKGISPPLDRSSEVITNLLEIERQSPWTYWLRQTSELTCAPPHASTIGETVESNPMQMIDGSLLRKSINDLVAEQGHAEDSESPAALSKRGEKLADVRQHVEDLDSRYRRQTFLLTHRAKAIEKATEDRFALDMQLFSLDHVRRTLDEYWCEARQDESPFFVSAADGLMRIQSFQPFYRSLDGVDLKQRFEQAKAAANGPETLLAKPGGDFQQSALLENMRDEAIPFLFYRPAVLPQGQVSVWTQQQSPLLRLGGTDNEFLTTSLSFPSDTTNENEKFVVYSFFRGLRRQGGLDIKQPKNGRVTLFRLDDYGSPTAMVEPDAQSAEKVVIVLDCSGSMDNGKLDQARRAVRAFLQSLASKQSSVGLVLFGHRYGWEMDGENLKRDSTVGVGTKYKVITYDDNHVKHFLRSLETTELSDHQPNTDVEVAVVLDRLNETHMKLMSKAIENTDAVGVTPTYQAIDTAYDVLGTNAGHIVVLTDGLPFLAGDTTKYQSSAMQKYRQNRANVRLSIVNYKVDKPQADLQNAFDGATFIDAKGGEDLTKKLQNTIQSTTVLWKQDGKTASDVSDADMLDKIVEIKRWPPDGSNSVERHPVRPALPFLIEATRRSNSTRATANVRVEGGEAFKLRVRGGKLVHSPFPRSNFFELRVDGTEVDRYSVIALSPVRKNRELTLSLVIERRSSGEFTPRPSDVWIDLVGTDVEDRRKIEHSIAMADFQAGQPVPVMLVRVEDWPDWAVRLHIDASMRFDDSLAHRLTLPLAANRKLELPSLPGVTFAIEHNKRRGHQLKITETFPVGSSLDERLRILPDPLPNHASVSFYREDGLAIHEFRYDEPQDTLTAFITKKSEIVNAAAIRARTKEPIAIRINGR